MNNIYKNCHKTLKILYDEWKGNNKQEIFVGSIKIAENTDIPIIKIHELQHILLNCGEIVMIDNNGQSMMSIQQKGITSYVEKKYIKEGYKDFWDGIFYWARIVLPIIAIAVSIYSIIINVKLSDRLKKVEDKIQIKKI